MAPHPDELLTPEEVAKMLRHEAPTLERWRSTGYGPRYVKFGRRVAYRREAVEAWIRSQERSHTNETRARRGRGELAEPPSTSDAA